MDDSRVLGTQWAHLFLVNLNKLVFTCIKIGKIYIIWHGGFSPHTGEEKTLVTCLFQSD